MPVILYDAKSRGAEAYLALAREVLERVEPQVRMIHRSRVHGVKGYSDGENDPRSARD